MYVFKCGLEVDVFPAKWAIPCGHCSVSQVRTRHRYWYDGYNSMPPPPCWDARSPQNGVLAPTHASAVASCCCPVDSLAPCCCFCRQHDKVVLYSGHRRSPRRKFKVRYCILTPKTTPCPMRPAHQLAPEEYVLRQCALPRSTWATWDAVARWRFPKRRCRLLSARRCRLSERLGTRRCRLLSARRCRLLSGRLRRRGTQKTV